MITRHLFAREIVMMDWLRVKAVNTINKIHQSHNEKVKCLTRRN
jgi:hypothetical protein